MRRFFAVALLLVSMTACARRDAQPASTVTDDTMSTGPSNTAAKTGSTGNTDTTYTHPTSGPNAPTGTPVSATGT